jgi:flagellar biosynthesis protein FlhF
MRLKTFSAKSMAEVMRQVRADMGEDAIIVATRQSEGGGVRVTAAVDQRPPAEQAAEADRMGEMEDTLEFLRRALDYHGVPTKTAIRLLDHVRANEVADATLALAAAVDATFRFAPLHALEVGRPLALIGPPGAGKTVTAAKLATRASLKGRKANLITLDTMRAGAVQQLSSLGSVLGIETATADSPARLSLALSGFDSRGLTVVDTAGVNPFDKEELDRLGALIRAADAETVLVLPAGGDAREASETALAFTALRPTRLIVTRLDCARRFGALIAAAESAKLAFTEAGTTAQIAHGLTALNPVGIARLLLRDPLAARSESPLAETALRQARDVAQ